MIARGYWNAKKQIAEDLPLLKAAPTLLDKITGNKVEKGDSKYFVQSPNDQNCFWSAKE